MSFRALLSTRQEDKTLVTELVELTLDQLMEGDVEIDVEYSTINFKDALAIGDKRIMRKAPLIPGIDLAGTVTQSSYDGINVGDKVLVNGWELSQTHFGGFAQKARVKGEWLVKIPEPFTTKDAMAIGTAGYTAMLCILALEKNGVTPDKGDVLVTGATGGVGSIAVAVLSKLGYRVVASTGRLSETDYLKALGAAEVIDRAEFVAAGAPLAAMRWAGAVDTVGSHTLVNVLAQTNYQGAVAACGLAQGNDLPGTVLPFILRGVTLAGIDSVQAPYAQRVEAWSRLARDLDLAKLAQTTQEIGLGDVVQTTKDMFAGKVRGRTIVDVNR